MRARDYIAADQQVTVPRWNVGTTAVGFCREIKILAYRKNDFREYLYATDCIGLRAQHETRTCTCI